MALYSDLPQKTGIYLFKDKKGEVLYIGKAINLKKRVSSYFTTGARFGFQTAKLVKETRRVDYFLADSEIEALLLEAKLINKYQPKYNRQFKDDKKFPSIGIMVKEELPQVFFTRRRDETETTPGVLFFGPFPNPATVKRVLKLLRKIFPFRSCKTLPQKPCLYFHLKLCPGVCFQKAPGYKQSVRQLVRFFQGKRQLLLKDLSRSMRKVAAAKEFEKAAEIKQQIQDLEYIVSPTRNFLDLTAPVLAGDKIRGELENLSQVVGLKAVLRVECFDVSNIQGRDATGSMAVFLNGEAEKSEYRRFKIRFKQEPDDVAMIKEVIGRRLNHPEWDYPDLIVVDGGRGQVGGAIRILRDKGVGIPVIGLAKEEETIILPKSPISNCSLREISSKCQFPIRFREINLPKDSPGLHLLQRLRDEAHRFAVAYHQKLRIRAVKG